MIYHIGFPNSPECAECETLCHYYDVGWQYLLPPELCQIYLSLIGVIDKNQIAADLSTYSALCGMMSKSTALVNSFFTSLWV